MNWRLLSEFNTSEQAAHATHELQRTEGIVDIQIRSSFPLVAVSTERKSSRIPLFSVVGALLGATAGFLMATLTALSFPIPTGGMPIVAWGPVGIVTYEATMLGAILATFGGFLFESRLPKIRPMPYDESDHGRGLGLTVDCISKDQVDLARRILVDAGGTRIRTYQSK